MVEWQGFTVIVNNQNRPHLREEGDAWLISGESDYKALIILQNSIICDQYTGTDFRDTFREYQHTIYPQIVS